MSLLDELNDASHWEAFYAYKASRACPTAFVRALRAFIDAEGWRPVCAAIAREEPFPLPRKAVISKLSTGKKRVVYTYPEPENTVLKLLTHLLLRRYDALFSPNLYSFRPGVTAKDAIRRLTRTPEPRRMTAYQTDVSNYFNSIPVERLLPLLEAALADDPRLFRFLRRLLTEPRALENGVPVVEPKGVMAGTPLSAFYANLYLADLDRRYWTAGVPYARYSDDVILFAPDRAAAETLADELRASLAARGLAVHPEKERFSAPETGWDFLGFHCAAGEVDIASASVRKIKAKMRRKTRALLRWRARSEAQPERAAAAFLRVFRRKLFSGGEDGDLTWSR